MLGIFDITFEATFEQLSSKFQQHFSQILIISTTDDNHGDIYLNQGRSDRGGVGGVTPPTKAIRKFQVN